MLARHLGLCQPVIQAEGHVNLSAADTGRLRRRGFRLEYATMAWMVAEAAVAITAGLIAASVALIGFGLDSVIELFSAAIVIWQPRGEIAGQDRQTRAIRLIGVTFFALAAYLIADSIRGIWPPRPGPRPLEGRPAAAQGRAWVARCHRCYRRSGTRPRRAGRRSA